MQFISNSVVDGAMQRQLDEKDYIYDQKIIGVDVARFGDDSSVIVKRQGLKLFDDIKTFRQMDLMTLSGVISEVSDDFQPDIICVDSGGVGGGVVDRLIQLNLPVMPVDFGGKATESHRYFNVRAEIWAGMRDWLGTASIPSDDRLRQDLISPEYSFDAKNRTVLERKELMKRRGLRSQDIADALACTFVTPGFFAGCVI